jgi:hypothetical protein
MLKELVKQFKKFCEMCEGTYDDSVFPTCKRYSFRISIEYLERDYWLEYFLVKIISEEGDEEVLRLNNIKILDVQRISENDSTGVLRYYTLVIKTDKGTLYLKRDIRSRQLVVQFESRDVSYKSVVLF